MAKRIANRRNLTKAPIGDMRDRITLLRRVTVPPQWDQPENTMSLTLIAEVWAEVQTKFLASKGNGDQIHNGVDLSGQPAYHFTIRFRSDIRSSDTVVQWRNSYYKIDSTESADERNQFLTLISTLKGDDSIEATQ